MSPSTNPYQAAPEMQELSDQIGEFVYYWGFKRIHGKMWTHLFIAQRPLDAADLVGQMKISKALVSISLRELLDFEVIQMIGKSERGTQLYQVNPDLMSVIFSVLRKREKRMLSRIAAAHQSLARVTDEGKERMQMSDANLQQLGELIGKATDALDSFLALKAVDFGDWEKAFCLEPNSGTSV